MRFLIIVALLLYCFAAPGQRDSVEVIGVDEGHGDPFANLEYDNVVAYNLYFDTVTNEKLYGGYIEMKKYEYEKAIKSSIRSIDHKKTKKLIALVSANATYGENYGDCFDPRLAITFLNRGQEIFTLLVCFECNFLESTKPIPAARSDFHDTHYDESETNEAVVVRRYMKGFSKKGRKKLLEFCRELNMKYCG